MSQKTQKNPLSSHFLTWALLALPCGVGCSYYSETLLAGLASAEGGAGTDLPDAGGGGSGGSSGGASTGEGGTLPTTPATGGAGSAQVGGTPGGTSEAGAAGHETSAGGEGGEGPTDACPEDLQKLLPGECGCGVPETCADLRDALVHRYSFDQAGQEARDAVGDAHGTIVGTAASGGRLSFDGTAAAYLDLPNGIVSSLQNASFEIWLTWGGGPIWQRIFDFGSNDEGEGNQGSGLTYLYVSPSDGATGNALRASFSVKGVGSETVARAGAPLPTASVQHLVLVVDDANNEMRLFLNGNVAALTGFTQSLASLNDVNNWVGRSNFADAPLKGTIEEVRIYGVALTPAQVTASRDFGPNPNFL